MADYSWPAAADRKLIGSDVLRIDSPLKVSGKAPYMTDVNLPDMLYATTVRCPHAHAKVLSIDTSAAEKSPGCRAVFVIQKAGAEIFWAGDDIVAVAAVDELSAAQAANAVKIQYQELPHLVVDSKPESGRGLLAADAARNGRGCRQSFPGGCRGGRADLLDAGDYSLLPGAARLRRDMEG